MVREILPPETARAFAAMRELRPHFTDPSHFVRWINDLQRPEGYRLVGAFTDESENAVSVAGFRLATSLSWGRYLYIDDLSTQALFHHQGHAHRVLAWVINEAQHLQCQEIHLDSGVDSIRYEAHRLYLNQGFAITAHHFKRAV